MRSSAGIWARFVVLAAIVIAAGYWVTQSATAFAAHVGISHTIAGGLFTAVATSLPELVTSIAAVRRGALTLAVGGVVGGNCFDTLFAAAADVFYRDGSLYHAAFEQSHREMILLTTSIMMTTIILFGLLRREKHGPAGIGLESVLVLLIYVSTIALLWAI